MPRMKLDTLRKELLEQYESNWKDYIAHNNNLFQGVCMGLGTALIYLGIDAKILKSIRAKYKFKF